MQSTVSAGITKLIKHVVIARGDSSAVLSIISNPQHLPSTSDKPFHSTWKLQWKFNFPCNRPHQK